MDNKASQKTVPIISTLNELSNFADYSFMDTLESDPDSTVNGNDHEPRQVFTGHYVPVKPTQIQAPEYIAHSHKFFSELGFADSLATSAEFIRMFSGDISQVPMPMRKVGWATGYALSIFGTEYTQQCPFQTGNGYGDGRAVSVLEANINDQRWEMQLKGGGRTPYCRGADGRAVLRSSVREFLAQEHMHALGVPTSRSLSLFVSKTETVKRPWYSDGSTSIDPDIMLAEPVAITTRVAPSFIRVGQIELFGRRARNKEHPNALQELEKIVLHLIDREYSDVIDNKLDLVEKVLILAEEFRDRLTSLVANWIRVGYCQGNFNSDNCAAGGFTLDYGPFGFCEMFDPQYQPWTGGGVHFSFFNQAIAAEHNFNMFCKALQPLLDHNQDQDQDKNQDKPSQQQLLNIQNGFAEVMQTKMEQMWREKLGLTDFNEDILNKGFVNKDLVNKNLANKNQVKELVNELLTLMLQTPVDYTIFFRELSKIPDNIEPIKRSFYKHSDPSIISKYPLYKSEVHQSNAIDLENRWEKWLQKWKLLITNNSASSPSPSLEEISKQMLGVNPKYILREWMLAPAYKQAFLGNYELIHELQVVMTNPYAEQSNDVEEKYYKLRPTEISKIGGLSHLSCSS